MTTFTLLREPSQLEATLTRVRADGRRVALVPTMGNLHAGHLALIKAAREAGDFVLASIFVNPLQFGPGEDLDRYPRTFAADQAALVKSGCDALFAPSVADMYPQGMQMHTSITVPVLSTLHCGRSRPGHFDGVCTVVCKLFNMVRPDNAYFGLKDFQQFRIISKMVEDLHMAVQMHAIPTVREQSGLALSSRNGFLNDSERAAAPALYATLRDAARELEQGLPDFRDLEARACNTLASKGLRPDYFHICRRDTLQLANTGDRHLVILAAAYAGTTRLIDNIFVLTAA